MRRARDETDGRHRDGVGFARASELLEGTPAATQAASSTRTSTSSSPAACLASTRSNTTTPTRTDHSTQHNSPQRVVIKSGSRSGEEVVVVNSPYGAQRARYGWGTLFEPPRRAVVPGYTNIHIGISSLNAVPTSKIGSSRPMKDLMEQYRRKFDCLEHCYTYHNVGDGDMWRSWSAMAHDRGKSSSCRGGSHTSNADENSFVYTIKANRLLTHAKQLLMDAETEAHIKLFFDTYCAELGTHLGPVLLQLPPFFLKSETNMNRLRALHHKLQDINTRYDDTRRSCTAERSMPRPAADVGATPVVPTTTHVNVAERCRDGAAPPAPSHSCDTAVAAEQPTIRLGEDVCKRSSPSPCSGESSSGAHACRTDEDASITSPLAQRRIRVAVEFRHVSWYHADVFRLLRELGWSLVVAHHASDTTFATPVDTGSGFLYLRLHGSLGENVGDYGPDQMNRWAVMIQEYLADGACGASTKDEEREEARAADGVTASCSLPVNHRQGSLTKEVFVFLNNTTSHLGGTTSSVVDATYLAERLGAMMPARSTPRAASTALLSCPATQTSSSVLSTPSPKREEGGSDGVVRAAPKGRIGAGVSQVMDTHAVAAACEADACDAEHQSRSSSTHHRLEALVDARDEKLVPRGSDRSSPDVVIID